MLWTDPRDITVDELAKLIEGAGPGGIVVIQADAKVVRLSRATLLDRLAEEMKRARSWTGS